METIDIAEAVAKYKANTDEVGRRRRDAEEVIGRYGEVFSPEKLEQLTAEDFRAFLLIENNKHWNYISRHVGFLTADMPKLGQSLRVLVDEDRDLVERLNLVVPNGAGLHVRGLGRAICTPILLVVYPDSYGVYNQTTELGMKACGLHPHLTNESFGERYKQINARLTETAREYGLTLFELDHIWWGILQGAERPNGDGEDEEPVGEGLLFPAEAALEQFMIRNWQHLSLADEYDLYTEDGDLGVQFNTGVGRIDILARHKQTGHWLVIELKKGRHSDQVVGQLLRYMGWIRCNKAEAGEEVRGLVIVAEADASLRYAVVPVPQVEVMLYKVNFSLHPAAG